MPGTAFTIMNMFWAGGRSHIIEEKGGGGGALRGKADTGKSLSFCETSSWGSPMPTLCPSCSCPPPASGYWSLKETRFLPGAFYVGHIPRPATLGITACLSQDSPDPSSETSGHLGGFCSKPRSANYGSWTKSSLPAKNGCYFSFFKQLDKK